MSCCQKNDRKKVEENVLGITDKVQLWMDMTKYMLECADISLKLMREMKNQLGFSRDDLIRFSELCSALEDARHEFSSLGYNFLQPRIPPNVSSTTNFIQSPLTQHECCSNRLNKTTGNEHKDACFCNQPFSKYLSKKKPNGKVLVCSSMKNSNLKSKKCIVENLHETRRVSESHDDHPFIIKHPGKLTFQENGVGYELFHAMNRYNDRIAQIIESTEEKQTFEDLLNDSVSVAIKLRERNFNEDDIIFLCASTFTKNACVPYLGGLLAGCIINTIDISFRVEDVKYALKLVQPSIIIAYFKKIPDIVQALQSSGIQRKIPIVAMEGTTEGAESFEEFLNATDDEIKAFRPYKVDTLGRTCIILFSSGTTGFPKGICLSHRTMIYQFALTFLTGCIRSPFLSFSTYYWISAVIYLGSCILGGCARVVPNPSTVERIFSTISKFKVETYFLGPYEAVCMAEKPTPPDVDLSCLKIFKIVGMSINAASFYALQKKFPECSVTQGYGLTETAGLLLSWNHTNTEEVALSLMKSTSVGRPFGGCWYKIVDEDTGKILGPNEPGELRVKSDSMLMKGYLHRDPTEDFDKDEWLRTGDLCYYDDNHCFYVVDRLKDIIKYRGMPINPNIMEQILMTHPDVARAVVIGIPHPIDCERSLGVITLKQGINPESVDSDEILEFVNNQVSDDQQLKGGLKIVETIPLTTTGKVKRRSLRNSILEEHQQ